MKKSFEIIDSQPSPIGEITLRRRTVQTKGESIDVYEVKLGEEFLMSSLFHVAEEELAHMGLAEAKGEQLDVLVGGLGLGYTAAAALDSKRVKSLVVVDALDTVIKWHTSGQVPLGKKLTEDSRCELVRGDFFAMNRSAPGFGRRFHAILLDVDHSPRKVLHPSHSDLYQPEGLKKLAQNLHEEGVFALWSDDSPDEQFLENLNGLFSRVRAEVVSFPNPLLGGESKSTVYIASARILAKETLTNKT